ncbi:hypothetical protein F4560_001073 [Saccharothrix ecbatanensis]|uniref:DUF4192 domain-containing protein n=1 Tax=Saccharothrix ecbatanensis TaxID=1105145 RepID=A0A7W9HFI9_9PSEU|nr:DUF4192 domain-containing protein [Saccharothrix ecbatanensis]MBB5801305.1 hypothetical protein [Saccharothrix ecbatanensis]
MNSDPHMDPTYPADFVASVPHLLGYHPTNSLVLVTTDADTSDMLGAVLRVVLPSQADEGHAMDELIRIVGSLEAVEASLAVICRPYVDEPPDPLPGAELVRRLVTALAELGVVINCQVWAASTREGAPWCTYDEPGRRGTVPDPNATTAAAENALAGRVTFDSREQLVDLLATDASPEVLERRAKLLVANDLAPVPDEEVLDAAVERAEQGDFELTDHDFATLGTMLSDPLMRDQWVGRCAGDHADAAERLVLRMVRGLPEPWRAHAAAVYAFAVYLRGEGTLAGIAVGKALEADPDHCLANLLRRALNVGMSPYSLREALDGALG